MVVLHPMAVHVASLTWVGGHGLISSGIYTAELYAVFRTCGDRHKARRCALQMYIACTTSDRSRVRMPGHPLVYLISKQIISRHKRRANVSFGHVHSHTGAASINAVGNCF